MGGDGADNRLKGWKEIAEFLHVSERTVQRWQRLGLPIHRVPIARKAIVFGDRAELSRWTESSQGQAARGVALAADATDDAENAERVDRSEPPASPTAAVAPVRLERRHPVAAYYVGLAVLVIALATGLPLLTWRASLGGQAPQPDRSAAASSRAKPSDRAGIEKGLHAVCSDHYTLMLAVKLGDDSDVRIGVTAGAIGTYTFGDHLPLAITVSCLNENVLLHIFQVNSGTASRHRQLQELATVGVAPGGRADVPPGLPFKQVWWLRTLPPPPSRTDPAYSTRDRVGRLSDELRSIVPPRIDLLTRFTTRWRRT